MASENKKPRTLIIGLDGATYDLLNPWIAAGHLPTLARLRAEGTHGVLDSWPNTNSAVAWTSIVTGYNPGQHGVFDFGNELPQRGQRWRPVTGADRRKPAFWRTLSEAGKHTSVFNVPISYPAEPVTGYMLAGMDSPGVHSPGFSQPAGFYESLRRAGIAYVLDVPRLGDFRNREPHRLPDPVRSMVEARARTVLHVMQNSPWEALMAVFVATDRMQHSFWPHEPLTDANPAWRPLRDLYKLLDHWLGEMLRQVDDQTTVIVLSDHGFGPFNSDRRDLNSLLLRLGLAHRRVKSKRLKGRILKNLLYLGRRYVPLAWQMPLAQAFPGLRLQALDEQHLGGLDWSRTQVFTSLHGGRVYINLRGRQPEGIVAPEDYEPLRQRVVEIASRLIDPVTGQPQVKGIARSEELFRGPYADQGGDLVVRWNYDRGEAPLCYQPVDGPPISAEPKPPERPAANWKGQHRPEGIFIAWGPNVKRGAVIDPIRQYDVVPTVLHLHGLPVPADMDGRVLAELFTEAWLAEQPVRRSAPAGEGETPQPTPGLDEEEMGQVEARLRDLGYIE